MDSIIYTVFYVTGSHSDRAMGIVRSFHDEEEAEEFMGDATCQVSNIVVRMKEEGVHCYDSIQEGKDKYGASPLVPVLLIIDQTIRFHVHLNPLV